MKQDATTLYVGIDVSKLTLDVCIRCGEQNKLQQIKNTRAAVARLVKGLQKTGAVVFFGMENTGRYNYLLYGALVNAGFTVFVINALHLKKSLGLVRGKNDRVDAARIATFVETHHRTLQPWTARRTALVALQALLAKRTQLVKLKKQLATSDGELGLLGDKKLQKFLIDDGLVARIQQRIDAVEARIDALVSEDEALYKQTRLLRSVPGIGKVLAWQLLVKTNEFRDILDARKLACYAGVVPFDYTSGTSVRGKPRVSFYADKSLKSLLHLAAMSVIRLAGELRDYYKRKTAEGKNKMSVLNAIRNKIVHRACAVIKNETPYVPVKNNLVLS